MLANLKLQKIGENINKIRVLKGISIETLSINTNIRKEYLVKIEKGKAIGMKISHILKIARGLMVYPSEIVDGV